MTNPTTTTYCSACAVHGIETPATTPSCDLVITEDGRMLRDTQKPVMLCSECAAVTAHYEAI